MPSQKLGVLRPHSANSVGAVVPRRVLLHRRDDAGGNADAERDDASPCAASCSVTGSFSATSEATELLSRIDLAQVPRQHALIQ